MTNWLRPKGGDELARDREQVEALLGPEAYYGEQLADYDIEDMSARATFVAHALRRARGIPNHQQQLDRDRHLLIAMNRLQDYVADAEADPSSSMLRPGQIPLMRSIADFFEDDAAERRGGHATLPTSIGKTIMIMELVHATGLRTLFVTPTKDLMFQTRDQFEKYAAGRHLDIGFVYGDEKRPGEHMTITPYASVTTNLRLPPARRVIKPEEYDLVAWDEVHEILGQQRRKAVHAFPRAIQVGFTATDTYSEHKQVADVLPKEIVKMDIIEAQDKHLVAPHHNIVVQTETDMREVYVASTGDYAEDVLYRTINTPRRNRTIVESYQQLFAGKKAIFYCAGIDHAKHLAEMFNEMGSVADHINGEMSKTHRRDLLERLKLGSKAGGIDILCNDKVLGAGTDQPTVEVVGLARPTVSSLRLLQTGGRSTRLWDEMPDKVGYVLQYVDQNFVQPPMLYAEDEASGYARHAWEGFEYPLLDISGYNVPNTRLMVDSEEVKELADAFSAERNLKPRDPPENWKNLEEVATHYDISKNRAYQALQRFELALSKKRTKLEADPDRQDELDELLVTSEHKGGYMRKGIDSNTRMYLSPELIAQLETYLYQYEVAPSPLWRTVDDIAAIYDRSTGWVNTTFMPKQRREKHPDEFGKYVMSRELGNSRWYYSPGLMHIAAEEEHLEDYSYSPPSEWFPENKVIDKVGPDAYAIAFRRLKYSGRHGGARQRIWYGNEMTRNGVFYCSPLYQLAVEQELQAPDPRQMQSLHEIADAVLLPGVTPELLKKELEILLEKQPNFLEYKCGLYRPRSGGDGLVYYCRKELAVHIRENAIRSILKELEEEAVLGVLAKETDKDVKVDDEIIHETIQKPSHEVEKKTHVRSDDPLTVRTLRVVQGTNLLLKQIKQTLGS